MVALDEVILRTWQINQLYRVGDLIRGDWSGCDFDGRDVKAWICAILEGKNIDELLKEMETRND